MKRFAVATACTVVCLLGVCAAMAGEIHQAVSAGDSVRVARLLAADPALAKAPSEDESHDLPLHLAATRGQIGIARLLLDKGAAVDGGDFDGSTALHVAALRRQGAMVDFLVGRGADVNLRDRNGSCGLSFATTGGDPDIVRRLLAAGARPDWRDAREGRSLLHIASWGRNPALIAVLAAAGVDIEARDTNDLTPLMMATYANRIDNVRALLAAGARPDALRGGGASVLLMAAQNGTPEMIALLLPLLTARGVTIDQPDTTGWTPLLLAIAGGKNDNARALLTAGARADLGTTGGFTPIFAAARAASGDVAQMLIDRGVDVNKPDETGGTPLLTSAREGNAAVMRVLLAAGAHPTDREAPQDRTPLHLAALGGWADEVTALLEKGADPDARDADGLTPHALALAHGNAAAAGLLATKTKPLRPAAATADAPAELRAGEAEIWYLGHAGWAVRTANRFLVFDYLPPTRLSDNAALANGAVTPALLAGRKVTVFVSHEHGDHLSPAVYAWRDSVPGLTYVFGCRPQGRGIPPYEFVAGRGQRMIDGLKVTTFPSTDAGVGFVVEADGVTICDLGDHANRDRANPAPFRDEIDYLAAQGVHPDLLFAPITGCGFNDLEAVADGVKYALAKLRPRAFFPMHGLDREYAYAEFVSAQLGGVRGLQTGCADYHGSRFLLRAGKLQAMTPPADRRRAGRMLPSGAACPARGRS